jgi:hypothetical protein
LQRLLTTATIAGLLIATAAAFAITERLKLTKSAVYGTHVSTRLSPTCGCARGKATIFFKLRRRDHITVTVLDARKDEVALLADATSIAGPVRLRWNGRTDAGTRAPDGSYYVRIHLAGGHQTITLPNRISLDTKPPQILTIEKNRDEFSPDRDRQADFVRLTYRLSKPAHVLLFLGRERILGPTHSHVADGSVSWNGLAHGRALPAGIYTLEVGALDQAGNSTPVEDRVRVTVEIRYIALAAHRIVVHAGSQLQIGVSTDAKRYSWKLGNEKGKASGPLLRVRAPKRHGAYTLVVEERGHLDRARVVVR